MLNQLPQTGFVKLPTILSVIPVSKSTWWAGCASGRYPKPVKHGASTFWRVEDIHNLIKSIENGE